MKKSIAGCLCFCAALTLHAALEDGFRDVLPLTERPWCYWWWLNGHVDKETVTRDLEATRRVGFGGFLIFDARGYYDGESHLVLPKPKMAFMGPEWREMLAFSIREAARVGLEVSVNLSSCAGALKGPWEVGADAPKRLVCQTVPLPSGTRFDAALETPEFKHYWDIAAFAVKYEGSAVAGKGDWKDAGDGPRAGLGGNPVGGQKDRDVRMADTVVELTGRVKKDGRLAWDVPPGQWALVRFGYTVIEGHEYDVDVLDAKAVEGHFNRMGLAVLAAAGPLAGKALTHFYSVSWEGAVPTWTGAFERDFAEFRGYAIRPWMPALAGFILKSPEATERFMGDYRRARNDAFRERFYGTMMALCHRNGLRWHSESGGPWSRQPALFGEADQLAFLARNDMPQGEFWYKAWWLPVAQFSRPQAMAAHVYGKRLAASEAFTHMTCHWSASPGRLKRPADLAFCAGVNQLIWHTFTCSPKAFGEPGIEYFSGTATYAKTFELTDVQAGREAVLGWGEAGVVAQVWLNGKELGTVWTAPWEVDLTGAMRPGKNELRIAVTNLWVNRLIGDAGLPPEQRVARSNMQLVKGKRFVGGKYVLNEFQGFASEDPLERSGLTGPVRIDFF